MSRRTTPVTRQTGLLVAENPGAMTLGGTNTWVLSGHARPWDADTPVVVVDPGPALPEHLEGIRASGRVVGILVTHRHRDHTESAADLARERAVPYLAADASLPGASALTGAAAVFERAGVRGAILPTPGHTPDSVCIRLDDDGAVDGSRRRSSVLTGDTMLGSGTTIIAEGGSVSEHLASLRALRSIPEATGLPGHGPVIENLASAAEWNLAKRIERIEQLRAVRERLRTSLGSEPDDELLAEEVYGTGIAMPARWAVLRSVAALRAHLDEVG